MSDNNIDWMDFLKTTATRIEFTEMPKNINSELTVLQTPAANINFNENQTESDLNNTITNDYNSEATLTMTAMNSSPTESLPYAEYQMHQPISLPTMRAIETEEQFAELKMLLESWELSELYDYFIDQQIYLSVLKQMRIEMAPLILKKFAIGVQLKFDYKFNKWRQSLSTTNPISTPAIKAVEKLNYESLTSSSNDIQNQISLHSILDSSSDGSTVIEYYKSNRCLNDKIRQLLVNTISEYFIRKSLLLTTTICNSLSLEIAQTFAGEAPEIYYASRKNACPRGKLYNKFHNEKGKRREAVKSSTVQLEKPIILQDNAEDHIRNLKFDNLSQPEIIKHWEGCILTRLNHIKSSNCTFTVMENWPHYKHSYGAKLIDIDFKFSYGEKNKIFDTIDVFSKIAMEIFRK